MITAESTTQSDAPVVGITLGTGYDYEPEISFDLGQQIGGPERRPGLRPGHLRQDHRRRAARRPARRRHRADHPDRRGGRRSAGIQQKIAGAEKAGATVFLVPAGNCDDLAGLHTDLTLIKVSTLRDAIDAVCRR